MATVSDDVPNLEAGTLLGGKYRVERVLGHGGMGVVVAAEHLDLRCRVAVKCIRGPAPPSPGATERFVREARVLAQLRSEHVVHVTDVGTLESGAPFIVMEYLEGQDLAQHLSARGPLPVSEAVGYVLQALVGLAEAHRAGVVHRDLKPSNLALATRPDGSTVVKILDFGISKILSAEAAASIGATTTGTAHGSPHYMSPEQIRDPSNVDLRTDIWSLGVVLYELLTGERPFSAPSLSGLAVAIVTGPPRPLRQSHPVLPSELERVVHRCLEKQPADRYPNVAHLAEALSPFGAAPDAARYLASIRAMVTGRSASEGSAARPDGSLAVADTVRLATFTRTGHSSRRKSRWLVLAAVVAVAAGIMVWRTFRGRSVGDHGHAHEMGSQASAQVTTIPPQSASSQPHVTPEIPTADVATHAVATPSTSSVRSATRPRVPALPSPLNPTPSTSAAPIPPPTASTNSAIDYRF